MLLDQLVQCVTIRYPTDKSSILTQRNDWISSDRQIFLASLWINCKQSVNQSEELHDSLILTDIFMALQEKHVFSSITTINLHLPGMLLRG